MCVCVQWVGNLCATCSTQASSSQRCACAPMQVLGGGGGGLMMVLVWGAGILWGTRERTIPRAKHALTNELHTHTNTHTSTGNARAMCVRVSALCRWNNIHKSYTHSTFTLHAAILLVNLWCCICDSRTHTESDSESLRWLCVCVCMCCLV